MAVEPLPPTLLGDRMPDWWRPFTVDVGGERVARVRESVEVLREALSLANAVDAVAYSYGDEQAGERIIGTVRAAARDSDGGYAAAVGDAEPPARVAAALADQLAVEPDSELSTLISLLVVSADWAGRRLAIEGMRLADYASRQLEYRSASVRRVAPLASDPSAGELVRDALHSLATVPLDARRGSPEPGRDSGLATQPDILVVLAARIDELAAKADLEQAIVREQLRQQTWMLQSWCETAGTLWTDVVPEARPVIAAVELAQRTRGATPAVGAEALLGSVVAGVGRGWGIDPAAAVAAAGPYIAGRLRAVPHPFLFPLAGELSRWRERNGEGDRDDAAGRLSADGPAEAFREETVIALQAYREELALRLLGYE